jgi:kynurenine formamidase
MKAQLTWQGKIMETNLNQPMPISIPIKDGTQNPNCYFAEPVKFEVIRGSGFVGSIKLGGLVNHQKMTISPHGNGTHTECYGHITNSDAIIATQLQEYLHVAQLISVIPLEHTGDLIIDRSVLEKESLAAGIKALVVRTMPNNSKKLQHNYSGTNPAYFSKEAMQYIVDCGIEHLVTDLPSVDKERDEGKLIAHKTFWQLEGAIRKNSTITELAYIENNIGDGLYLLDLQVLPLYMDASPSNPILYSLNPITNKI